MTTAAAGITGSYLCPKCLEGKVVPIKDGTSTNGAPVLFEFSAEDPFAQALYCGLVIRYLHRFEGAFQLIRQFWIEAAHTISELHAERLDAREFLNADRMLKTEVKKVSPKVFLFYRQTHSRAAIAYP